MTTPASRHASCLVLAFGILILSGGLADASSYYNVTDVSNARIGQDFSFPTTPTFYPTGLHSGDLPGVYVKMGLEHPHLEFFTMEADAENSQGTLLGGVPRGISLVIPNMNMTLGFARRGADGHYSDFFPLTGPNLSNPFYPYSNEQLILNAANQILVTGDGLNSRLVDVNNGTSPTIGQLISPDILKQYSSIDPENLADNGSILVWAKDRKGRNYTLLLTPPDLALPTPAPEPSTLTILAIALGGMALGRVRRSRRMRSGSPIIPDR